MTTINKNRLAFLAFDGQVKGPPLVRCCGTLLGLITWVASRIARSDSDQPSQPEYEALWEWARTAQPGAVNCFYDVNWIVAVDPCAPEGADLLEMADRGAWVAAVRELDAVRKEEAK